MNNVVQLPFIPSHERKMLEAYVRNVPFSQLVFHENPLDDYQQKKFKDLLQLRLNGLPLQYLIGSQSFYGRDFYVNTQVLIPRPETEGLVELCLKKWNEKTASPSQCLEIGTGTGCISITLGLETLSKTYFFASDAYPEALEVAKENASTFNLENIRFFQVTPVPLVEDYASLPNGLDCIISNPPYLLHTDEIAEDVKNHEPESALYCMDGDGFSFYRFLAELVAEKLSPQGFAVFEMAHNRSQETQALVQSKLKNRRITVHRDLTGKDRYLLVE